MIAKYYNKASFISTNHSHSLFRRKQNVQNILLKRVEDISKRYLLILYVIVRYMHTSNFNYKAAFTIIFQAVFIIIFVDYPWKIWMQTQCTLEARFVLIFFIDVLIKMFNCSMGHFIFQSVFYLWIIFKMPYLSIFIQFLQL